MTKDEVMKDLPYMSLKNIGTEFSICGVPIQEFSYKELQDIIWHLLKQTW